MKQVLSKNTLHKKGSLTQFLELKCNFLSLIRSTIAELRFYSFIEVPIEVPLMHAFIHSV